MMFSFLKNFTFTFKTYYPFSFYEIFNFQQVISVSLACNLLYFPLCIVLFLFLGYISSISLNMLKCQWFLKVSSPPPRIVCFFQIFIHLFWFLPFRFKAFLKCLVILNSWLKHSSIALKDWPEAQSEQKGSSIRLPCMAILLGHFLGEPLFNSEGSSSLPPGADTRGFPMENGSWNFRCPTCEVH